MPQTAFGPRPGHDDPTVNDIMATMPTPLAAWHQRIAEFGDRTVFTQPLGGGEIKTYSWSEADREARQIAAFLQSLNLPAGSRIGLASKNCADWIIADIAIMMSGHVSVPVYPNVNAEMVSKVLNHSEAELWFVGKLDETEEIVRGKPDSVKTVALSMAETDKFSADWQWQQLLAEHQPLTGVYEPDLDELCSIIYTSGTTGNPKGVMHSYRSLGAAGALAKMVFNASSDERMLSYLPLSHVAERSVCEMGALYNGYSLFFAESLDTFGQDLQRAKPTMFFAVPRIWMKFQQQVYAAMPPKKLRRLQKIPFLGNMVSKKILSKMGLEECRIALSGAAPISDSLMAFYDRLGLPIVEVYGMSENFGYSHSFDVGEGKTGYVGKTNPGVDCKIADNGEILVRSRCNMLGYYKQPDTTAETLDDGGWVHTGDKGEIHDGYLKITGRTKEIFKTSKGKYVAPAPIENRLQEHPAIEQVCVAGQSLPQALALINLSETADEASLKDELEALLKKTNGAIEAHERLSCLVLVPEVWDVDNGFMTPTLKIKRNAIEDEYADKFEDWQARREPVIDLR